MTWNRNGNPGAWPLPPAARASRGSGTTVAGGPCLASRCCRQASRVSPELASHQPSGPDAEPRAHAVCTAGLWRPASRFLAAPLFSFSGPAGSLDAGTAQHTGKRKRPAVSSWQLLLPHPTVAKGAGRRHSPVLCLHITKPRKAGSSSRLLGACDGFSFPKAAQQSK